MVSPYLFRSRYIIVVVFLIASCQNTAMKNNQSFANGNGANVSSELTAVEAKRIADRVLEVQGGKFDLSEPVRIASGGWILRAARRDDRTVDSHFFIRVLDDRTVEILPGP